MSPDELRFIDTKVLARLSRFERLLMFDWELNREAVERDGRGSGFWNAMLGGLFPDTPWLGVPAKTREDLMLKMRDGTPPHGVRMWNPVSDEEPVSWRFEFSVRAEIDEREEHEGQEVADTCDRLEGLVGDLKVRGRRNEDLKAEILNGVRAIVSHLKSPPPSRWVGPDADDRSVTTSGEIGARIDLSYSVESLIQEFRGVVLQLRRRADAVNGSPPGGRRKTLEQNDRAINKDLKALGAARALRECDISTKAEAALGLLGLPLLYDNRSGWSRARKHIDGMPERRGWCA